MRLRAILRVNGGLNFGWIGGVLAFVTVSGIAIWLLPFSVPLQFTVLAHTVLGLIVAVPIAVWQTKHWLATRGAPRGFRKFCGYSGFWTIAVALVSGLVVSAEAAFSLYVGRFWDRLHLYSGVAAVPFVVYHAWPHAVCRIVPESGTQPAEPSFTSDRRRLWLFAGTIAFVLVLAVAGLSGIYVQSARVSGADTFPSGYSLPYGNNPFSPSLAMTETGKPVPPALLAGSKSCGAAGCHTTIYDEWRSSAHRWSSEDVFFQKVQGALIQNEGVPAARYCAGCHDPVSLLSGYKDASTGIEAPGFKEGASCTICHGMRRVDVQGNGNYVFAPAKSYLFQYREGSRAASAVRHFLIRSYPQQHDYDYGLSLVQRPESCASCHKQFIDKNINHVGWVQLQNQYDDWRLGKWNSAPNPQQRLLCQQCHMYYQAVPERGEADPYDLKAGIGLKVRNHWFAAANQVMPEMLNSPGWREQVQRVNEWLKGEKAVPEVAGVWAKGPVMPIHLLASTPTATPGKAFEFQAVLTNNKAGHSVPTGPLDLIRLWVQVQVVDNSGRIVFHSGELTAQGHVEPGTFVLKAVGVNANAQEIVRHDLWHYIGAKWKRAVFPGYSDMYSYHFVVPRNAQGPLTIVARLRYRKANQYFMDFAFPGQNLHTPITDMSSDRLNIPLANAGSPRRRGSSAAQSVDNVAASGLRK
jgi:Cytochrome c554 and c-prime